MVKLKATGITKEFDNELILDNVSIHVDENEIIGIVGASGGGKTTLFNVIAGILSPESGTVELDGEDITGKPGKVSYMLQKDLLFDYMTIEDNVSLPLVIQGMKKKDARDKVSSYFEEFGLTETNKKYPASLSGGMRQRAALLRTYMFSQNVALLDEPFSALDTITKGNMHRWYLFVMDKIKLTTIFITHDIDEAIYLSDRIYVMKPNPGRIVDEITINEPKIRSEEFMLSSRFLEYKKRIVSSL